MAQRKTGSEKKYRRGKIFEQPEVTNRDDPPVTSWRKDATSNNPAENKTNSAGRLLLLVFVFNDAAARSLFSDSKTLFFPQSDF